MILQALAAHYDHLLEKRELERPGWQSVKVSFGLRLGEDGTLRDVVDLRKTVTRGKKEVLVPQPKKVPAQVKRSSGIAANFLCDNTTYLLGVDDKGKPERSRQCFEACAALHHALLDGVEHPAAMAVLRFFDTWQPELAAEHPSLAPLLKEMYVANLVFLLGTKPVQDFPEIARAWQDDYDGQDADGPEMRCLVTGDMAPVARLHPSIKGIAGAQATGASLVSFNAPAFESYGRDGGQGLNAPVSRRAAFAYGAALNHLVADEKHALRIGDMTVVYWAEDAEEAYADWMCTMLGGGNSTVSDRDLRGIMGKLAQGQNASWGDIPLYPDNRFYILGLAPNAARLSVRFFIQDSFGAFARHIQKHHERMEIQRPAFDGRETLSVWEMLAETVNSKSRDKKPLPQMAGDVLRAILTGGMYPATLYNQTQMRIRAGDEITRGRAAIIKAYLLRNACEGESGKIDREVLQVKLNEETTYAPYVLGRLFAVLEALQDKANPGINTTIRDRYFNSACCTPAVAFPTLIKLAQAHLKKLEGGPGWYGWQMTQLMGMLDEAYPRQLSLYDQGIFQLGYYHQTQKRYEKKEDKSNG